MLNYRNDANFYVNARQFIIGSEGFKNGTIYPDSVSIPTIGYGYALILKNKSGVYSVNTNINTDFLSINLTLTADQQDTLKIIVAMLNGNDTATARTLISTLDAGVRDLTTTEADTLFQISFDRALTQVENQFKAILGAANGHQLFASLTGSTEMIAIASLGYNNPGTLIGKGLTTALWNGNRAEAWYEIRYGSNSGASKSLGIANRRYRESDTFSLYNDAPAPTLDDAKQAYRMFTKHRDTILNYENTYSPTNVDAASKTIRDNLTLACATLLGDLAGNANANTDIANAYTAWRAAGNDPANFDPTKMFVGSTNGAAVDARQYNPTGAPYANPGAEHASNDIIIAGEAGVFGTNRFMLVGGMGNDLLIGSSADDVLYGNEGNDIMAGGAGNDTYLLDGGGADTIEDKIGSNTVLFHGKTLGVFYRSPDGTSFNSVDGAFTGIMQAGDFIVTDIVTGDQVTLNQNFTEGDFGITFKDAPVTPPPQYNLITGDLAPLDTDPTRTGIQAQGDALGNITLGEAQPYGDILRDSTGDDHILAGEGNDDVGSGQDLSGNSTHGAGDDWIEGGAGNDYLWSDLGSDRIEGGADSDILSGGAGNDQLYGDIKIAADQAIADGNAIATHTKGDWLAGGSGDDTVIGGASDDVLMGGTGSRARATTSSTAMRTTRRPSSRKPTRATASAAQTTGTAAWQRLTGLSPRKATTGCLPPSPTT